MPNLPLPPTSPAQRLQVILDLLNDAKTSAQAGELTAALFRSTEAAELLDKLVRELPSLIINQGEQGSTST